MSIQTDIETALLAALRKCPALQKVQTFEADIRDCLFTGEKLTQGFRAGELPALNLSATLDPTPSRPFTLAEIQHEVPVSICCITKGQNRKEAYNSAKALQEAVEGVLNTLRRSGNSLGSNALVMGDVSSSVTTMQDNPHCFAVGTTAVKILKITPLA